MEHSVSESSDDRLLSRREFAARLLCAMPLSMGFMGALGMQTQGRVFAEEEPQMSIRRFANLGFKIGSLSYDATALEETGWKPLSHALNRGFDFIVTSPSSEKSEELFGENFMGRRERIMLCTRWPAGELSSKESLYSAFEKSRGRLQTKYIDFAVVDDVTTAEQLKCNGAREAFARLKAEKRVRYLGFSCRKNYNEVLKASMMQSGFDIIILEYTINNFREVRPYIEALGRRGVGIIVANTLESSLANEKLARRLFGRRNQTTVKTTIEWVLGDRWISSLLVTPRSIEDVEEYIAASVEED